MCILIIYVLIFRKLKLVGFFFWLVWFDLFNNGIYNNEWSDKDGFVFMIIYVY